MSCSWTALLVVEQLLLFAVPSRSHALFSVRPVDTEAEANSTFSLRCACTIVRDQSDAVSRASLDYVVPAVFWLKNSVLLTDIDDPLTSTVSVLDGPRTIDSVVTVADAQWHHRGTYTCICLDEADKRASAIAASCSVALVQQPLVSIERLAGTQWVAVENNSRIEVARENTLALRCRLLSPGNASLIWLHDAVRVGAAPMAAELTLQLDGAVEQDAGVYSCSAGNSAGFSSVTVQVQVGVHANASDSSQTFAMSLVFAAEDFAVLQVSPSRSVSVCLAKSHSRSRASRTHFTDATHAILSNLNSATEYQAWVAGSTCSARRSAVIVFSTTARNALAQVDDSAAENVPDAHNNDQLMQVSVDKDGYLNVDWSWLSSLASCLFYQVFTELVSSDGRHQVFDKYLLDGIRRNLRLSLPSQQCATLSVVCHTHTQSAPLRSAPVHICVGQRNETQRLVRRYRQALFSDESDVELLENSTALLDRDATTPAKPHWEKVQANSTAVSLSWSYRGPTPDNVEYWEVRYGLIQPDQFNLTVVHMNVTIAGLQPGNVYVFSVSGCNQRGCGVPLYESLTTESVSDSSQLLPPLQVVALTLNSTAVLVSWLDQSLTYRVRDSRYYSVRVTPVVVRAALANGDLSSRYNAVGGDYLDAAPDSSSSRVRPDKQRYINTTDSKIIVDTLRPFTEYEFEVCVHKGAVQSGWSMKAHNRTLEAPPSQAPLDLQVFLVGGGRFVELRWRHVPAKHQNGVIKSYQVAYSTNDDHPDSKWVTESVNSSLLSFVFKQLVPETGYYFKVRAKNSRGFGPFSGPVYIQTMSGSRPSLLTSTSTTRVNLNHVTNRPVDDGKLHGIAFETWYIIIGCATGLSIVVFIVVTVSVVKKRRRSAEIQRRKAEYVSRRLSAQPGSAAVSSHSSSASSSKASSTNKKSSPIYSASANYQYTAVKHKALEPQCSEHTTPTVRFNVRYNQVQQVTPLASPAYSPVSSSDALHSAPDPNSNPSAFPRSHTQLSKVSAYDQLTSGYCPSVDTCSSATSAMTNPRQPVGPWTSSAHEVRDNALSTPPTARHIRRGSGYHPRLNDEPLNCAATEIGLPSYCTANARGRFASPDGNPKRHLDLDPYNQPLLRYPSRKDDAVLHREQLGFRPDADFGPPNGTQIVHPVQPYRVVDSGRKNSDQLKRPDAEALKNPVSILKVSATDNGLSHDAMRRASAEFADRHAAAALAPPIPAPGQDNNDPKTPIFANLTTEQAKNPDKSVKFIPLVKVNVPEPCDADSNKTDAQSSDANTHVTASATSQLSSHSQSSSTNSTGITQIPSAQLRNDALTLPISDLPHQSATSAAQKACCAKSCAFCTADDMPTQQKGAVVQQCGQLRSSDSKPAADLRKHPERTFSHFYTERV